jgi:DNA-binding response OmpR family regulator
VILFGSSSVGGSGQAEGPTGPSVAGRSRSFKDRGRAEASSIARVDVLLVSPDERSRQLMALSVRSIERRLGRELRFRAARNGELGTTAALRDRPDVIVADEIASRAGAFGLARTLRDDAEPYTGVIVILLDRKHDAWLAKWSGADAWFVKPVDPFELADRLLDLVTEKESA